MLLKRPNTKTNHFTFFFWINRVMLCPGYLNYKTWTWSEALLSEWHFIYALRTKSCRKHQTTAMCHVLSNPMVYRTIIIVLVPRDCRTWTCELDICTHATHKWSPHTHEIPHGIGGETPGFGLMPLVATKHLSIFYFHFFTC